MALDFPRHFTARIIVVRVRMENLRLILFLLNLPLWLYARNPALEVLRIPGPLFLDTTLAMHSSFEYNARTTVVRV